MLWLSVIIPVYNAELYLSKCIHSIVDNNSLTDIEIILIDDGSQDYSGKICEEFAAEYDSVRVFHQPNSGVAETRNFGLRVATGKYIAWVDSDDYVEPDWLPDILTVLKNESPDLVMIDYYEETCKIREIKQCLFPPSYIKKSEYIYEFSRDKIVHSYLWQYIIKRKFYTKNCFDSKNIVLEDYSCLTYLIPDLQTLYYLKRILYHYVQRENSLIHSKITKETAMLFILKNKERYEYLLQKGFHVSAIKYWSSLIGNYGFLCYEEGETKQVKAISREIAHYLWQILKNSDLSTSMKIKAMMISYIPARVYKQLYSLYDFVTQTSHT